MTVTPSVPSVFLGATQQFTATVANSSNQAVNWTVNSIAGGDNTVGTISAAGLYTAPQILPAQPSVTIRATSQADSTKSATAAMTILSDVSVAVSPNMASVILGTTGQFTAVVTGSGSPNLAVTWTLAGAGCAGSTCGTVDSNGLYTAPPGLPAQAVVTVRATSQAESAKSGTAAITVTSDLAVSVTPSPATVLLGAAQQFVASISSSGNPTQQVAWNVSGSGCIGSGCGAVDALGKYTAPAVLPSPSSVAVTATSVADTSKMATATVTLSSGTLAVTMSGPTILDNLASAQYTASVIADPGSNPSTAVAWSVAGAGCAGSACGTILNSGFYVAPEIAPNPNVVVITATSEADSTKMSALDVTIRKVVIVSVEPGQAAVELESSLLFTASVLGTTNRAVIWDVDGIVGGNQTVGTITNAPSNPSGSYQAPTTIPAGGLVTVRATSVEDPSKSAPSQVSLFSTIVISLTLQPDTIVLNKRARVTVQVSKTDGSSPTNQGVQWFVNGVLGGNSTVGQICVADFLDFCSSVTDTSPPQTTVEYLAPSILPANQFVEIRAVSKADSSRSGTRQIRVIPAIEVTVFPFPATLATDNVLSVGANVLGTTDQRVTWTANGIANGDLTVGQICQSGGGSCAQPSGPSTSTVEYRAPGSIPAVNPVTIRATSAEDTSRFGEGNVLISQSPPSNTPTIQSLIPSSFTAAPISGFVLKVQGLNFAPTNPGPGSEILFNGVPRTTNCTTTAQCTISMNDTDASVTGENSIQIRNPDTLVSNQVILRVVPPGTTEGVISLAPGAPAATGKDITVVEAPTAGAGLVPYNVTQIGILETPPSGGNPSCTPRGTAVRIDRPSSGSSQVDLCLIGDRISGADTYTLSGPNDIILSAPSGNGLVQFRLTISSTTLPSLRTLFIENVNKEKTAATGAIEVK